MARVKPIGRQAIWEAIRARRDGFGLIDLVRATKQDEAPIKTYVIALHRGGYIAESGSYPSRRKGAYRLAVWTLVKDVGNTAPRLDRDGNPLPPDPHDHLWRAIRILGGTWTIRDLAFAATTDDTVVTEAEAAAYCRRLTIAGYLQDRDGLLRLLPGRNTGPLAPMVARLDTVFDPNLGSVVWQEVPRDR